MSIGFENGEIRFDEPEGVYYSGQEITGKIVFLLDRTVSFSGLAVRFYGAANVLWTEIEERVQGGSECAYKIQYAGGEIYFDNTENLIGGTGPSELRSGAHAIPFQYRIPSKAPSSFEGEKGEVHYNVTATMTYYDSLDHKDEICKEFKVVAPFDLNKTDVCVKKPINLEFEELYGCDLFCVPDPISVSVRLPVSGYCPGQRMPITLEVNNESSREITKMKFQLVTKECYRSTCPVAVFVPPEKVIAKSAQGAVMANSKSTIVCEMVVPEMIAPHLDSCGIIDLRYFFRITIKVSGCGDEMQDEAEIFIGLVPLVEITDDYTHPLKHSLPSCAIPDFEISPVVRSPGFAAATNIEVKLANPLQATSHISRTLPYPSENPPHPSGNNVQIPPTQRGPFRDYEIGFKLPGMMSDPPPYPTTNLLPSLPYPVDDLASVVRTPPYPTGDVSQVNPPPYNESFSPSAPPPF